MQVIAKEAQRTRDFVASTAKRKNRKGQELKSNVTDNDSAKMATSKGVIQGYAAQAAVDSQNQVIVAADVLGSSQEQMALLPMVELTGALRHDDTVITTDAGYHSNDNLKALCEQGIPAMIADKMMRQRDERFKDQAKYKTVDPLSFKRPIGEDQPIRFFKPSDFRYDAASNRCICPAGESLHSKGANCVANGRVHHKFMGSLSTCMPCKLRSQCIRHPERTKIRQVALFAKNQASPMAAIETMKRAIDSPRGRRLYSQRIGTVEPVFANLRHNKRLNRFTLRGRDKVDTQWHLYCLVHNIEKIAKAHR